MIILLSLIGQKGSSCSCPNVGDIDSTVYEFYSSIVLGEILKTWHSDSDSLLYIQVLVQESYHGNNPDSIIIKTPRTIGACGITPQMGEIWLLFSVTYQNELYTNRCTRSGDMDLARYRPYERKPKQIKEDLAFLKK